MIDKLENQIQDTYDIIEEIGSGGGGTIYKAFHKRLQKYVVLKKIHSNIKDMVNIRMETDILKNLHHYYLPQVLDFLEINNDVYTVMDFIPGKSFDQLLKEGKVFSKIKVLKYTEQLCEAVAYLHEQLPPIMHGDIKPANIMLTPEDNICLIDFNISGVLSEGNMVTVGFSAGYAAPEQCLAVQTLRENAKRISVDNETELLQFKREAEDNEESTLLLETSSKENRRESVTLDQDTVKIDLRADVYSIGATIYHLATGIRPESLKRKNKPLEEVVEEYSSGFSVIISKAMELEPANRFKDAGEMLLAVRNIHKYDKKYKSIVIRQEVILLLLVIFMGISLSVSIAGKQKMNQEKIEAYEVMIEELAKKRIEGADDFEAAFHEACVYMPERLDAYYQKALFLTDKEKYSESVRFIHDNLVNEANFQGQYFADDTYYLLANCYFELEEYKEAAVYYSEAIKINEQVSGYYGDYAIALVYCERIDEAEAVLQQGREKGMSSDYVLLVSAEIEAAKGKNKEAIEHFKECIQITENQAMRLRAYVLCDKTLREQGATEEILQQSIELLIEAEAEVELSDQMLILERLAQSYIDLAVLTEDVSYDGKAIDVFQKIIQYGWDNYTTHINLAILYEKTGQLEQAEKILKGLTESASDNYVAYKRLAILEIDIQGMKENEERDYGQFSDYYDKTMELYEQSKKETNDVEIQWLEQTYEQLVSGGWLEE